MAKWVSAGSDATRPRGPRDRSDPRLHTVCAVLDEFPHGIVLVNRSGSVKWANTAAEGYLADTLARNAGEPTCCAMLGCLGAEDHDERGSHPTRRSRDGDPLAPAFGMHGSSFLSAAARRRRN